MYRLDYFQKAGGAAWRHSAQVVDLLDCLLAARFTPTRDASEAEAAAGLCILRGRYSLPRAWFTSLPLEGASPSDGDTTTPEDARLMAFRLRRLVRSSNEHYLDSVMTKKANSRRAKREGEGVYGRHSSLGIERAKTMDGPLTLALFSGSSITCLEP